ncbi:MAG: glycosyltransferase family 39 protein [Anaerolineales bacterium]|nr:glycosyltransferase family 39 protein [Anaerolineales bacterium]
MKSTSRPLLFWILLALISGLGFGLVWYCTVWGGGLISDSFQYVASARNLAAGQHLGYPDENGNTIPLSQYPPFFSVALAAFELAGVDSLGAARLLNAVLFAANIWLVGISILKISHSSGFALVGGLLTALSAVLIEAHAWVLSEPLFIFLSLLAFYWLGEYIETSGRQWFWMSALATSLALLTRYVGLALLLPALVVITWKSGVSRRKTRINGGMYVFIVLLPMAIWSLKNYIQSGQLNNREFQWVPLTTKNMYSLGNTIFTWFIPENLVNGRERWAILFFVILLIGFGIALFLGTRESFSRIKIFATTQKPLFLLHGLYIPFYIAMVIASKMLVDNQIGMTDRMFSPLLVSLIIPGSALLPSLWLNKKKLLQPLIITAIVYLIVYFTLVSMPMIGKFHRQGIGLARSTWQTSAVIQSLPEYEALPIYSNSPSTLYFWTRRTGGSVQALDQQIKSNSTQKAIMVIFYHIPPNNRIDRLEQTLTLVKGDDMAKIYVYEP